jgi:hypothetical protein
MSAPNSSTNASWMKVPVCAACAHGSSFVFSHWPSTSRNRRLIGA